MAPLATLDGGLALQEMRTAADGTRKLVFKLTHGPAAGGQARCPGPACHMGRGAPRVAPATQHCARAAPLPAGRPPALASAQAAALPRQPRWPAQVETVLIPIVREQGAKVRPPTAAGSLAAPWAAAALALRGCRRSTELRSVAAASRAGPCVPPRCAASRARPPPAAAPRRQARVTLCVSSQVGCAMNCQFCYTGAPAVPAVPAVVVPPPAVAVLWSCRRMLRSCCRRCGRASLCARSELGARRPPAPLTAPARPPAPLSPPVQAAWGCWAT